MRLRPSSLLLVLTACALIMSGALGPLQMAAAADKKAPKGLTELGKRLTELAKDIAKLVEEANKDPDERKIDVYAKYSSQELKKLRKRLHADDLVKFMVDATKNLKIRQKAREAIEAAAIYKGDPDLSNTEKKGTRTKRAYFCDKFLTKHLKDDNRYTRELTHLLLIKLWGSANRVPEIAAYSTANDKTWRPAIRQWGKYLRAH